MKPTQALTRVTNAGYHGNTDEAKRLYISNRISRDAWNRAWIRGVRAKKNGLPCDCAECAKAVAA